MCKTKRGLHNNCVWHPLSCAEGGPVKVFEFSFTVDRLSREVRTVLYNVPVRVVCPHLDIKKPEDAMFQSANDRAGLELSGRTSGKKAFAVLKSAYINAAF